MGELGALGDIIFIWAHRMGQNRDLTVGNFDSRFGIEVTALSLFI